MLSRQSCLWFALTVRKRKLLDLHFESGLDGLHLPPKDLNGDVKGEVYDPRSQVDVRHNPRHGTHHSVRWLLSADFVNGQEEWVHGECPASELFPGWARPCGRHRNSFPRLSATGRCGSAPVLVAVVDSDWCAAGCDSNFRWILSLSTLTGCYSAEWGHFTDLRRSAHPCRRSCRPGYRLVEVSATRLDLAPQFIKPGLSQKGPPRTRPRNPLGRRYKAEKRALHLCRCSADFPDTFPTVLIFRPLGVYPAENKATLFLAGLLLSEQVNKCWRRSC